MSTDAKLTGAISLDILTDGEVVIEATLAGKKPDPVVAQRIRERAKRIREQVLRTHGVLNMGTSAIRDLRDA